MDKPPHGLKCTGNPALRVRGAFICHLEVFICPCREMFAICPVPSSEATGQCGLLPVLGSVQTHKCISTGKAPPSMAVPEVSEPWASMVPKHMIYYFMRNCCSPIQSNLCPLDWCSCQWTCTVQRLENVYFSWGASASRTLWDKAAAWHLI